jgi:hypothetical protein
MTAVSTASYPSSESVSKTAAATVWQNSTSPRRFGSGVVSTIRPVRVGSVEFCEPCVQRALDPDLGPTAPVS